MREFAIVPVNADGKETKAKKSKQWRLSYRQFVRNVPIDGDRLELLFDEEGVVEVSGVWHRLEMPEGEDASGRLTSLKAAKKAKMTKGIARLLYLRFDGPEGVSEFRPVFRFTQGKKTKDVEVLP